MSEASLTHHFKSFTALRDSLSSIDSRSDEQAGFINRLKYILHQTSMSTDASQENLAELFPPEVILV